MDETKVKSLIDRVIADRGGSFVVALAYVGDRLGLFRAMHGTGPLTSEALARRAGLNERYVREWLKGMVAAEYLEYDPGADAYSMTEEQGSVLADEASKTYLGGVFQLPMASFQHMPRFLEVFRDGGGLSYAELGDEIVEAHDRSHRSPFEHSLVQDWLPQVDGLEAKLHAGAEILDVGCGLGRSSLVMARAYPRSRVHGLDADPQAIRGARASAEEAGVDNLEYLNLPIGDLPPDAAYDFIFAFDCIHDMADPLGALKAIRGGLEPDGVFVWSELNASNDPLENRNPVGRMISAISPFHCLTVSLAYGGMGLGNMLGESGVRELAIQAEFSQCEKLPIKTALQQFFALRP